MGINTNTLRFLLHAKATGVDYTKTATLGRLRFRLSVDTLCEVMRSEFSYDIERKAIETIHKEVFADGLLKCLGAREVHSFDYSDYEGATHTHDFNHPIAGRYAGQYTALIDGGTLEHIFNFPVAIENCMQMLKLGGHYCGFSPTNNQMGHGFYQFSPELFFRIFCRENGFRVEHIVFYEGKETKQWFRVADPRDVNKKRPSLANSTPTYLGILASRVADCPIFAKPPQQSAYVSQWKTGDARLRAKSAGERGPFSSLMRWLPPEVRNCIRNCLGRNIDRAFFKRFDPLERARVSTDADERKARGQDP
jgi:hypothetical protein